MGHGIFTNSYSPLFLNLFLMSRKVFKKLACLKLFSELLFTFVFDEQLIIAY